MKRKLILASIILLPLLGFSQKTKTGMNNTKIQSQKDLKTTKDTASFMLGSEIGQSLKESKFDIDLNIFFQGLQDSYGGKEPVFSQAERIQFLQNWQMQQAAKESEGNKKTGQEFLEKNKKQSGVVTTNSGLQYKVITLGTGAKPLASDNVKVHYKGTLIDGTVFDSSYDRGEPIEFPLSGVIAGWTEGVQLMPVGSKYMFYIPSELGYGDRAAGSIPPGSVLIFEVELLDITTGK